MPWLGSSEAFPWAEGFFVHKVQLSHLSSAEVQSTPQMLHLGNRGAWGAADEGDGNWGCQMGACQKVNTLWEESLLAPSQGKE